MIEIRYSAEVNKARAENIPLVALESTIITHGMPWPKNLEMARGVEQVIRDNGAIPATIAVIEGQLCIGLDDAQLEGLAQTKGAAKLSRADMAACMATGGTGATTVAATMIGAAQAGIGVFATGGQLTGALGGQHDQLKTVFYIFQAVFNGNAGHENTFQKTFY